jgi:Uma2 family endonuclease
MKTATLQRSESTELTPYVWTRSKYEEATALGLLGPEDHVELIEGEIVAKMTQNSPHSTAVLLMEAALLGAFSAGFVVRGQMPLSIGNLSQPEPDTVVVKGSVRDYAKSHPTSESAVLIVEVSDTSLATDRNVKASLYASAGIPEYWIINLAERVLEVRREPIADEDSLFGYAYDDLQSLTEGAVISPLAAENAKIAVSDLLR